MLKEKVEVQYHVTTVSPARWPPDNLNSIKTTTAQGSPYLI